MVTSPLVSASYVIGALEIDPGSIRYDGDDVYHEAMHKFVVELRDGDEVALFACPAKGHLAVAEHFKNALRENRLIGGGSMYIDGDGVLVVGSFSGNFGFLPKSACEQFAKLVMKECRAKGMAVTVVRGDPTVKGFMDEWWETACDR